MRTPAQARSGPNAARHAHQLNGHGEENHAASYDDDPHVLVATDAPLGSSAQRRWVLSLVDDYELRLTRYACRITGDLHSARDCVQHAFVKLCDQTPAEVHSPAAWLYRVCHHRALDVLRQSGRTRQLDASADYDEATSTTDEIDQAAASNLAATNGHSAAWPFSRERDPGELVEQQDTAARVRQVVARLPESQRQVIDLWCDGFSYREISAITGHGEAYVRVLAHRALEAVRNHPWCVALRENVPTNRPS